MSKKSKTDTKEKMDNEEQNVNAENIEETVAEPAEEAEPNDNVTDTGIEEKLAASEARVEQLIDQNLRQMAEFDNYRKRTVKEKAELIKTASADILTKLLPVIDDLERAITNNGKSDDITAIKDGTKLIYSKLMHILDGEGLKKIPAKGEEFNTDIHEAIATIPATDDVARNTIIDCTRDGYMLNGKLLRTSQVVVAN
ncbi:MAG: nucleotide exchange factor GrpE [Bacteroidaceae bacterium]|nr:nucleotide exchange factor GrpE [Bacteroidaceae bacterium]